MVRDPLVSGFSESSHCPAGLRSSPKKSSVDLMLGGDRYQDCFAAQRG